MQKEWHTATELLNIVLTFVCTFVTKQMRIPLYSGFSNLYPDIYSTKVKLNMYLKHIFDLLRPPLLSPSHATV